MPQKVNGGVLTVSRRAVLPVLILATLSLAALLMLAPTSPGTSVDAHVVPVAQSLCPLGRNLMRVWGFNAATQRFQLYDPAAALLSDLTVLSIGQGYWINVTSAQTATLGTGSYSLSAGWNLIGWLGDVPVKAHQLQVRNHAAVPPLGADQANAILLEGTSLLETDDGSGDVATCVHLVRTGQVTTFTIGNGLVNDGIINTEAEFDAVVAEPGRVNVVNQINWCGPFVSNAIGCAPPGGSSFTVVRHPPTSLEGVLWVHEFGHNKGLEHRNDLDANPVMYYAIHAGNRWVNAQESDAYGR